MKERDPVDRDATTRPDSRHGARHLGRGDVVGDLRIEGELGRGGQGTVFRATLLRDLDWGSAGDSIALKTIPHAGASVEDLRRLRQEAEVGQAVDDRHVVKVHDLQCHEIDGARHEVLVMELVEGAQLADLFDELGPLPEPLLRDLGRQAALGLAALHEAGVVHRDVKPENMVVTPDDRLRLVDLGIAHLYRTADRRTAGPDLASFPYASPEQLDGERPGPASDLYSLGVVLYEAATGQQPFHAESRAGMRRRHAELVPERAGRLRPELSRSVEELLVTLLAKDPARRLADARRVAEILATDDHSAWWLEREGGDDASGALAGGRRARPRPTTSLHGRRAELDALRARWRAARDGEGGVVLVEGEVGIGKSRLVSALLEDAESDDALLLAPSSASASLSGLPAALAEALRAQLGAPLAEADLMDLLGGARALAEPLAHALGSGGEAREGPTAPRSGDAVTSPPTILDDAWLALVRGLTDRGPMLVALDDGHAASVADRELTLRLARLAPARPLLLVIAGRPPLRAEEVAELHRRTQLKRLHLERLPERDVRALLREATGSGAAARRLAPTIALRSDGNPFFVLELVKELERTGALAAVRTTGPTGAAEDVAVPPSVRDLLRARLAALDEADRALLDGAAVQGVLFDPDLLARAVGRPRLAVLQSLARLERRDALVRAEGTSFSFDHHQLREVVLEELPPALLAEHHSLLADAHAEREGLGVERPSGGERSHFQAQHLLAAGRAAEAMAFLDAALDHLEARRRGEEVAALVDAAIRSMPSLGPDVRCRLRLRQAAALFQLGRRNEQAVACDRALADAQSSDDHEMTVRAWLARARLEARRDDDAASEALGQAAALARRHGEEVAARTLATCVSLTAQLALRRASWNDARAALEELTTLARRIDDSRLLEESRAGSGLLAQASGDWIEADRAHAEALASARRRDDPWALARSLGNSGLGRLWLGDLDAAARLFEEQVRVSREVGYRRGEAAGTGHLATCRLRAGHASGADEAFDTQVDLAREIDDPSLELAGLIGSSYAAWWRGDVQAAERRLADADPEASTHPHARLAHLGLRAALALELGRTDDALELAGALREAASALDLAESRAWALETAGRAEEAAGRLDRAVECHSAAQAGRRALGLPYEIARSSLHVGRALLLAGRHAAASDALAEADELVQRHGFGEMGVLPRAWLAVTGQVDPEQVGVGLAAPVPVRAEAHAALWRAGGGRQHEARGRSLLERMGRGLDAQGLERLRTSSPVARLLSAPRTD